MKLRLKNSYLHSCSSTQFTYNDTGDGRAGRKYTNHHHRHQASSKNHQLCHTISILSLSFISLTLSLSTSFVDCFIICTEIPLVQCSIICSCTALNFSPRLLPPLSLSLSLSLSLFLSLSLRSLPQFLQ